MVFARRQRRFGGRLGYELRDSASVPYFGTGIPSDNADTIARFGEGFANTPRARSEKRRACTGSSRELFRLWNAAQSSLRLECTPHSATLVFEDVLRPRVYQEWDDFPYPPSLRRNGRYYGDISMTVAFSRPGALGGY